MRGDRADRQCSLPLGGAAATAAAAVCLWLKLMCEYIIDLPQGCNQISKMGFVKVYKSVIKEPIYRLQS